LCLELRDAKAARKHLFQKGERFGYNAIAFDAKKTILKTSRNSRRTAIGINVKKRGCVPGAHKSSTM
jgi:hypothetical protein